MFDPKGGREVPSVGLIIITSMAFHIVQRQIQTHQPNQQKEHPLLYDFNKSKHECNMSTDHIQFTVGGRGMAATVRYRVAIKWSQKEQQISSEYVKWVPARHSVGRMYLKPCERTQRGWVVVYFKPKDSIGSSCCCGIIAESECCGHDSRGGCRPWRRDMNLYTLN